ncbi:hypothetical protein H4R24_002690 [Coemansia sp. RSA 988]|nr:hypothetical protein H4R24_002690 [Coemansia sp. RSA 988]
MQMKLVFQAAILATLNAATSAALCGCSRDIALRITNVYENGDTEFHYDYCENLQDGRGFTAGISGYCTGTGDAWQVIQQYHKLTGGKDDFSIMDMTLQKYSDSGSDSTIGLENYCKVWTKLGKSDSRFQQAQDIVRNKLYYNPSQKYADDLGLQLDISRAQMYDTAIEHGTSEDADGLEALINYTNAKFTKDSPGDSKSTLSINGKQVDEIVWLTMFLKVREDDLKNPKETYNQGGNYWAQTVYRTKSYKYAIEQGEYMFSNSVKILDNDGQPMTVTCNISSSKRRRRRDHTRPRVPRYRLLAKSSGPPKSRRQRPAHFINL